MLHEMIYICIHVQHICSGGTSSKQKEALPPLRVSVHCHVYMDVHTLNDGLEYELKHQNEEN